MRREFRRKLLGNTARHTSADDAAIGDEGQTLARYRKSVR